MNLTTGDWNIHVGGPEVAVLAEEQRSRIQDLEARLARLEAVAPTARAR